MNHLNLKGRIVSKYGTVQNFAVQLGWSLRRTYDIVNGKQEATAHDIEQMAEALSVNVPEEFRVLFLQ